MSTPTSDSNSESVTFSMPFPPNNNFNLFGDYKELVLTATRQNNSPGTVPKKTWTLVGDIELSEQYRVIARVLTEEQTREALETIFMANANGATSQKWQPIETAPRDGTRILLFCPDTEQKVWTGSYYRTETFHHGKLKRKAEGWENGGSVLFPDPKPTHWMPLPAVPCTQPAAK